ncbi:MAG: ABC-three component system middle component 6 [Dehalococcoidia bacterium]
MLLPTKGISAQRALITVGADLLEILDGPTTVSALWDRFRGRANRQSISTRVTFDWFSLALASLFATGAIELTAAGHLRRRHVR